MSTEGNQDEWESALDGMVFEMHKVLGDLKTAMAEPILRLIHETSVGPDGFGFDPARLHECAKNVANTLRSEMYSQWDSAYDALNSLHGNCMDLAGSMMSKYGDAAFEEMAAKRQINELNRRIAALQAAIDKRRKEHSPSSPEIRSKVLELTGGRCAYCDAELTGQETKFHVDHVVPKSAGGPDHLTNYVPSCERCNAKKSSGHVLDFIKRKVGGAA